MRLLLFVVILFLGACSDEEENMTYAEKYPGPWREHFSIPISKTFVKYSVRDCGEYHYREHYKGTKEYLVYCTRDGSSWSAYLVWPLIEKLTGPHLPDRTVPPPR